MIQKTESKLCYPQEPLNRRYDNVLWQVSFFHRSMWKYILNIYHFFRNGPMTRMWFLCASLQSFPKSVDAGSTGRIDLSFRFYTRRISRNMEDIARHAHSGRRSGLLLLLQTSTGLWSSLKILSSSVLNQNNNCHLLSCKKKPHGHSTEGELFQSLVLS